MHFDPLHGVAVAARYRSQPESHGLAPISPIGPMTAVLHVQDMADRRLCDWPPAGAEFKLYRLFTGICLSTVIQNVGHPERSSFNMLV